MANVKSFGDLNAEPLPNPWRNNTNGPTTSTPKVAKASRGTPSWGTGRRLDGSVVVDEEMPEINDSGSSFDGEAELYDAGPTRAVRMKGLIGEDIDVPLNPSRPLHTLGNVLCGCCCPCCLGPVWSDDKRKMYTAFVMSFCFFVSLLQTIMMILEIAEGGITSFRNNPAIGPPVETLRKLGGKDTDAIVQRWELWRLITPTFLHTGLIHLAINVFFQLRFALPLEKRYGLARFVPLYILAAVGGNLLSAILTSNTVSVGASTALLGILGCQTIELISLWPESNPESRYINMLQAVIAIIVLIGLASIGPYIDWAGHLGGLIVGFCLGTVYFSDKLSIFANQSRNLPIPSIAFHVLGGGSLCIYFIVCVALLWILY